MGKMILDDLRKRLERLDEDADLMIDNNDRYQLVIVGGSAFILLGKLTRATHDIDALSVPKELYSLLGKYDINTEVEAYIDNFPYNFQDRLQPLPFGGAKVQFYTPSLEDLVIAKLCSFRDTDKADVESEAVRNSLDWDLLEHLATDEDELRASILNDWQYRDFYIRYQAYRRVLELQQKKKLTNYRLYTDLKLNPGNVNAWLKHNDSSKMSLDCARQIYKYAKSYPSVR